MKRRDFIAGTGLMVGAAYMPTIAVADDASAVEQAVKDVYSVFYADRDKQKYRSLLTEDYLLLENGEILDIEGDLGLMPSPDSDYKRTDTFDFRLIKIHGDTAYAVYVLKSEITDKQKGNRKLEWLESAVLRRSGARWLMALLHSTRIVKP